MKTPPFFDDYPAHLTPGRLLWWDNCRVPGKHTIGDVIWVGYLVDSRGDRQELVRVCGEENLVHKTHFSFLRHSPNEYGFYCRHCGATVRPGDDNLCADCDRAED